MFYREAITVVRRGCMPLMSDWLEFGVLLFPGAMQSLDDGIAIFFKLSMKDISHYPCPFWWSICIHVDKTTHESLHNAACSM